jgi:hypothetical protein
MKEKEVNSLDRGEWGEGGGWSVGYLQIGILAPIKQGFVWRRGRGILIFLNSECTEKENAGQCNGIQLNNYFSIHRQPHVLIMGVAMIDVVCSCWSIAFTNMTE